MSALPGNLPNDEEGRGRWHVGGSNEANWALRKLADVRAAQAQVQADYDQMRADLDAWRDKELDSLNQDESFFSNELTLWHMNELDHDPKRKTVNLPSGKLKARKLPDRIEVEDDAAFVEWARDVNRLDLFATVIKHTPSKQAIKNVLEDGEALPGVRIVEGAIKYDIETKDQEQ